MAIVTVNLANLTAPDDCGRLGGRPCGRHTGRRANATRQHTVTTHQRRTLNMTEQHTQDSGFAERIQHLHHELGIPRHYAAASCLALCEEPPQLVETEPDVYGRPQRLTPEAFAAWRAMKETATAAGVEIFLVSAFRSVDYQCQIFRRKLEAGQQIDGILSVNAAPGYSEHHTGRAIDIGTCHCPALEEEFERTPAFAWLDRNAAGFGFHLSYPRDNSSGISYEPWHWCYAPP